MYTEFWSSEWSKCHKDLSSLFFLSEYIFVGNYGVLFSELFLLAFAVSNVFFFLLATGWTAYQTVSLSDRMGGVIIKASIENYQCDILKRCGQELEV